MGNPTGGPAVPLWDGRANNAPDPRKRSLFQTAREAGDGPPKNGEVDRFGQMLRETRLPATLSIIRHAEAAQGNSDGPWLPRAFQTGQKLRAMAIRETNI
jgi:hypothetical protein